MSIEAAAQRGNAHYSSSAYHPARIPDQPASAKRGWLKRFGNSRLPWGHTQSGYRAGRYAQRYDSGRLARHRPVRGRTGIGHERHDMSMPTATAASKPKNTTTCLDRNSEINANDHLSQEGKGIQATPRGDDFDRIHRVASTRRPG